MYSQVIAIGILVMDEIVNLVYPVLAAAIRTSSIVLTLLGIGVYIIDIRRHSESRLGMAFACISVL